MATVTEHLLGHARQACGLVDPPKRKPSYDELKATQWSPTFETYMRNRLIMGAIRYGQGGALGSGPRRDNMESILKRCHAYLRDGNQEHLVDIANLCLIEFVAPGSHPDPKWAPQDEHDMHAEQVTP